MLEKRHKEHMLKLLLYSTDLFRCLSLELCAAASLCPERCYLQIHVVVKYQARLSFVLRGKRIHNNCCTLNKSRRRRVAILSLLKPFQLIVFCWP